MMNAYDEAQNPFFSPRRLGATAPACPEAFAVDYRDTGEPLEVAPGEPPLRTIEDATLTDQLGILMMASLQVKL